MPGGRPKSPLRGGWLENGIGHIPLTKGKVATVDAADLNWLIQWNWAAQPSSKKRKTYYAQRTEKSLSGKKVCVSMHRLILGLTDPKIEADHRDQNGINNQRYNLRPSTHGENMQNRSIQSSNTTGYKGVTFDPKKGLYRAEISVNGKKRSLGRTKDPRVAYEKYVAAAKELHGDFACL